MIERKQYLLRFIIKGCFWIIVSVLVLPATSAVYAQDADEEGEIFWGGDEEEDEYAEDDEEYLDIVFTEVFKPKITKTAYHFRMPMRAFLKLICCSILFIGLLFVFSKISPIIS